MKKPSLSLRIQMACLGMLLLAQMVWSYVKEVAIALTVGIAKKIWKRVGG